MAEAKRIAVTGAAGQIGYSLLPRIAAGEIFGPDTPVILQMLEIPPALNALRGTAMELDDCAFPLLQGMVCTDDPETAFKDADLALLVGSKPRGKGMERNDLIRENGPIFVGQGAALGKAARKNCKVVVVGNPCNTNALIAAHHAAGLDSSNITAMTQLDHNRAVSQLAARAGVDSTEVDGVVIWGNHSSTQYPDWHHATINGKPAADVIGDDAWLQGEFITTVQKRGAAIIEARGLSSAMSAANAAIDHSRMLFAGTPGNSWTSMAVRSEGEYGTPAGILVSLPVRCPGDGSYQVVEGLEFNDFGQGKLDATVAELLQEREVVAALLA